MAKQIWGIHNDQPEINRIDEGGIRIGWNELGNLDEIDPTRDAFKERFASVYPDKEASSIPAEAGTVFRFKHVVKEGDLVVSPNRADGTLDFGIVSPGFSLEVAGHRLKK